MVDDTFPSLKYFMSNPLIGIYLSSTAWFQLRVLFGWLHDWALWRCGSIDDIQKTKWMRFPFYLYSLLWFVSNYFFIFNSWAFKYISEWKKYFDKLAVKNNEPINKIVKHKKIFSTTTTTPPSFSFWRRYKPLLCREQQKRSQRWGKK